MVARWNSKDVAVRLVKEVELPFFRVSRGDEKNLNRSSAPEILLSLQCASSQDTSGTHLVASFDSGEQHHLEY